MKGVTTISKAKRDLLEEYEKEEKSERGMPRLPEAKKDVVSCEKPRGFANRK